MRRLHLLVVSLVLSCVGTAHALQAAPDFGSSRPSSPVRYAAQNILATKSHHQGPFAVVDKREARLYVFDADGRLLGQAAALIGSAPGDHTVPGVGDKPPSALLPHEKTTPAGRFISEPGTNLDGERVVWVDYDSGFAIHRVRPGRGFEHRVRSLRSDDPASRRLSLGCVVVDGHFFDTVVQPVLGTRKAVVYVLPETRPVASLFGTDVASR